MSAADTAHADQADAAEQDAQRITDLILDHLGNTTPLNGLPPALVRVIGRHVIATRAGQGLDCPHLDPARYSTHRDRNPAPRFAVGHYPGRETCLTCTPQLAATPEEDRRCDQCGTEIPEPLLIRLVVGRISPVVLTAGFCDACFPPDGAT